MVTLEASGAVSLIYLQAMTLMAVYEYSHSIYPAAWMTVGSCARLAELLGISPGKDSMNIMSPIVSMKAFKNLIEEKFTDYLR